MITPRLNNVIQILRRKEKGLDLYREVYRIAWEIFRASTGRSEKFNFTPTKKELSFQEFIYQWGCWFGTRHIPFEYWSDICEEGLELTLKFIESDLEDYKELEGYEELREKYIKRIVNELPKSGKFTAEDMRAWDDMGH